MNPRSILRYMYWTYENYVHRYARVHDANCSHCNDGNGTHSAIDSKAGAWLGPFGRYARASTASKYVAEPCGHCVPGA
jgi:hypothetical protein